MDDEKVYVLGLGDENQKIMDTLKAKGISGVEFVSEAVNDAALLFVLTYSEKERSLEIAQSKKDILTIAITQEEVHGLPSYAVYDHEDTDGMSSFIRGISGLITAMGFVDIDINDLRLVMKDSGIIAFGHGTGEGEDRCIAAARSAIENMKLNPKNASSLLMNLTAGPEITMSESFGAADAIDDVIDPEAKLIWGHMIDESLGDGVRVSLYASRFSG